MQTCVPLRNAIKTSCLCKFIVLSAVAARAVSLSQRQNGKSCDGSEEEREPGAKTLGGTQSVNTASLP